MPFRNISKSHFQGMDCKYISENVVRTQQCPAFLLSSPPFPFPPSMFSGPFHKFLVQWLCIFQQPDPVACSAVLGSRSSRLWNWSVRGLICAICFEEEDLVFGGMLGKDLISPSSLPLRTLWMGGGAITWGGAIVWTVG